MTRTRRIWYKDRQYYKWLEYPWVSDKKYVSCVRKQKYIRQRRRRCVRAQNRTLRSKGLYYKLLIHSNELRSSEWFD